MITVSEKLKEIIERSPFLEEGLARGIVNLSALARELKPELERELMKEFSESAIMMALKRLAEKMTELPAAKNHTLMGLGDLTVRSRLKEFTFRKSSTLMEKQAELLNRIDPGMDHFVTFTQGVHEVTVIISDVLEQELRDVYASENLVAEIDDLAAVIIKFNEKITDILGIYYFILKQLAWKNINVIEVVSTFSEFIAVLDRKDVDRSFSVLLNYMG